MLRCIVYLELLPPAHFMITVCILFLLHSLPTEAQTISRNLSSQPPPHILSAFQRGDYQQVIQYLETLPSGQEPPREILRTAAFSYVRLGNPDQALKVYARLVPDREPDDPSLLREIARGLITSRVRDHEEHVRIIAYTVLREIAGPDLYPLFEDGLLDSSVLVRARAAEGLGRAALRAGMTKRASALAALKRALQDPVPSVRIAALAALGELGSGATDAIARLAEHEEGAVQVFALGALYKLGRTDALVDIRSAATLPEAETRMAAIGVLGRLKPPGGLSILSQAVYDPDPSVRAFAAGALGEFGDPNGASSLMHAAGDDDPRVRRAAAASLGRLHVAHARPLLWQMAKDPVPFVRAGALEGLSRLGDPEAGLLAADLSRHPDPSVRSAAAQAFGDSRNKQALPLLDRLRTDLQPQPRFAAAGALGKIRGADTVDLLKKFLQDSDTAVRLAAAGSLIQALPSSAKP